MPKIKIVTDSASDISPQQAEEMGIGLMNFPIAVGDNSYREHVDFTAVEFYDVLRQSDDIPHTSQVTAFDYADVYTQAYAEGCTDLINVVISSTGSNCYNNAIMSRDSFYEEHPEAKAKFRIIVMDSKGYTGAYGFPVLLAAQKIKKGATVAEVTAFLQDWFDCSVIICTAYTLKYARKSGRVGCVAAFVGEVLGLRPIITFKDAVSETIDKIRGDRNVPVRMIDAALAEMVPQTPYVILVGSDTEKSDVLAEMMKKKTGYPPEFMLQVGATIACHLGHDVCGIVVKGKNRRSAK